MDVGISDKVDKVQGYAAKWALNARLDQENPEPIHYTPLVAELGWASLKMRRENNQIIFAHKLILGTSLLPADTYTKKDLVQKPSSCHYKEPSCGWSNELAVPFTKRVLRDKSCLLNSSRLYNERMTPKMCTMSVEALKEQLKM